MSSGAAWKSKQVSYRSLLFSPAQYAGNRDLSFNGVPGKIET